MSGPTPTCPRCMHTAHLPGPCRTPSEAGCRECESTPLTTDYTPTTDEVRALHRAACYLGARIETDEADQRFDRWLDERDREVAARAWDAGYHSGELTPNPYREVS